MAFTTKKSLLARVRTGDEISWNEFYETYRPLIILCGRDVGLINDEIDELIQLVMSEIFKKDILQKYSIEEVPSNVTFHYDPEKGRFRHYFKAIVRNQARKLYHKRRQYTDLDTIPEPVNETNFTAHWDEEWKRHLFNEALVELRSHVQAETYTAFEMYAIQDRPVKDVAAFLNMSVNSVYVAKNRCIETMKNIIENLEKR